MQMESHQVGHKQELGIQLISLLVLLRFEAYHCIQNGDVNIKVLIFVNPQLCLFPVSFARLVEMKLNY